MGGPGAWPVRPCPNCECFVSVAAKRCPRCQATLEPVVVEPPPPERELALVGASHDEATTSATTTDPIVRSVMARVALAPMDGPETAHPTLPKLPQPFATDPLEVAPFLGVPVGAPEPSPVPDPSAPAAPAAPEPAPPPATTPAATPTTDEL